MPPARKTKVFISHSAHCTTDREFMAKLSSRLTDEGFQVYCDQERLEIGQEWRNELYSAIGTCHAAIVLITKEALNIEGHPWVFHECSMLSMISWARQGFPIFPISMSGVNIEDIQDSVFDELRITDKQIVTYENLDDFFPGLVEKLSIPNCTIENEPLYYHYKRISRHLEDVKKRIIKRIVGELNSSYGGWDPDGYKNLDRLSRHLLSSPPEAIKGQLVDLAIPLKRNGIRSLLQLLAPFWLEIPSIARLESIVQQDLYVNDALESSSPNTAICLNTKEQFLGILQVNRAGYMHEDPYMILSPQNDAGENEIERLTETIEDDLRLRFFGEMPISDEYLYEQILKHSSEHPVFVILPHGTAKEVIETLRLRFRTLFFIVLIENDNSVDWVMDKSEVLEPKIEPESLKNVTYHFIKLMAVAPA